MEDYINYKSNQYNAINELLTHYNESAIQSLIKKEKSHDEMQQFLNIINSIAENHYRERNFIFNINKILQYYKNQIKQTLSNIETYQIFKSNKPLLLFLLKNEIITLSEAIYNEMMNTIEANGFRFCNFFYIELEKFVGEESMKAIKNELLLKDANIFKYYDIKRQIGENDSVICSLIRTDSVKEFISYVNKNQCSLSSTIEPSIFETNSFLIERKNTSLIEYSAFYGSVEIFKYLMDKVELTPSLWIYAIHSNNSQIIHILESMKIDSIDYFDCFIESIKCHHNDLAKYIKQNLLHHNEYNPEQKETIIYNYIKYYNYSYFDVDDLCKYGFFYLCFFNYNELVNLLLRKKKEEIKIKII